MIEGFRPGVLERLGYGPDVLHAVNPKLVIGRVTGWGQTGPLADKVGHDLNYIGLTGVLHGMGPADQPPFPPLNLIGDYGGGAMMMLVGLLAALVEAKSSGKGRVVDAAMTDGTALLGGLFQALRGKGLWSDHRGMNLLDGGAPFYRCYRCRDGGFVAVGAIEPRFYAALLTGLGIAAEEAPQYDMSRWAEYHADFEQRFAQKDRDTWAELFAPTEACVTPVLTMTEAPHHPHNIARGTFVNGLPAAAPRFSSDEPSAAKDGGFLPEQNLDLAQALQKWR